MGLKGGFQLMQILGLLGMSFDAVVVEFQAFLLLFRLALAILWTTTTKKIWVCPQLRADWKQQFRIKTVTKRSVYFSISFFLESHHVTMNLHIPLENVSFNAFFIPFFLWTFRMLEVLLTSKKPRRWAPDLKIRK